MDINITRCPTCGSDQIKQVCCDWAGAYHGQAYVVPALTFYECPVCGERVFEREAVAKIQAYSPAFAKDAPWHGSASERDTSRRTTDLMSSW